jgi:hypothetical protein
MITGVIKPAFVALIMASFVWESAGLTTTKRLLILIF